MAAQFGHDGLVVPPARADEVLDRLAVDAGLHRDRLAGLSLQAAEQPADDQRGVGPLLGAVEAWQIALQEGRDPVLASADLVGGHDGIGQEGPGVGVFQERHGGLSSRISSASDHNSRQTNAIVETVTVQLQSVHENSPTIPATTSTDEQWSLIEPLLPPDPGGGRPRKTSMRDVLDAIFYILRTGCQWRYLPADFPPKSTAWRYFKVWRNDGTLDKVHDALRRKVRTQDKPRQPRTSASVDSQSVDTTSGGEARGRDNAKNVDGRKRHMMVDSMGLLLGVLVTAADVDDAKGAAELFTRSVGQPMSKVTRNVRRHEVP